MDIRGKRVLVCGAGGFIGGHLVRALHAAGAASLRVGLARTYACIESEMRKPLSFSTDVTRQVYHATA